jgi:hypothetical protein
MGSQEQRRILGPNGALVERATISVELLASNLAALFGERPRLS